MHLIVYIYIVHVLICYVVKLILANGAHASCARGRFTHVSKHIAGLGILVIHKFRITHRTMMLTNDVQQLLFECFDWGAIAGFGACAPLISVNVG